MVRNQLLISGTVQGVGFRPYIYQLAIKYELVGLVYNNNSGVVVEIEGSPEMVEAFSQALSDQLPPLAVIDKIAITNKPVLHDTNFVIASSGAGSSGNILVPPDIAICEHCKQEIANPNDRHYRYPFTNCTNCGPRFTVVQQLPYDRHQTSMANFPLCKDCGQEYADPTDRRFHAQAVACPRCGPSVTLVDDKGQLVTESDPIALTGKLLAAGKIVAVKGLGGFHLSCDATNSQAVAKLRQRKGRPAKPFAIMCRDLEMVKLHCNVSAQEEKLLLSAEAPIVLLQQRENCSLPTQLTAGLNMLGVMLPYTPLHLLLLQSGQPILVFTSANRNGLPLVISNQQALVELAGIADYFLWHDREIVRRCDDSVISVVGGNNCFIRRSRGYVPQPVDVPISLDAPPILAIGADTKNTFCLLNKGKAYLSQHIGSVDSLEGQHNLKESVDSFCRMIGVKPEVLACDLHPQYFSRAVASEINEQWQLQTQVVGIQHHHAHLAACMVENGLDQEVIGIILDGTGYGVDGQLWGFEIMRGDYLNYRRQYYLSAVPLPGGEVAIRHPWITAASYLITFMGCKGQKLARRIFADRQQELNLIEKMLVTKFNTPMASSCGRLFDAVSALLGLCQENTYQGQAPSLLSNLVPWFPSEQTPTVYPVKLSPYQFSLQGSEIKVKDLLEQVMADVSKGVTANVIARRFHDTVLAMIVKCVVKIRVSTGLNTVVLSGGSWQNRYLYGMANILLHSKGFQVYNQRLVPPSDGGIALGQAILAGKLFG